MQKKIRLRGLEWQVLCRNLLLHIVESFCASCEIIISNLLCPSVQWNWGLSKYYFYYGYLALLNFASRGQKTELICYFHLFFGFAHQPCLLTPVGPASSCNSCWNLPIDLLISIDSAPPLYLFGEQLLPGGAPTHSVSKGQAPVSKGILFQTT